MSALRDAVLKMKLVDVDDLKALEQWPAYHGASLAERLYRSGVVSDPALCAIFVGIGATDGTDELLAGRPPPAALGALSRPMADKHRAIGLRVERARLVVAMLDPSDTDAIEKIMFFTGLAVEPRVVRPRVLFQALSDAYGVAMIRPDAAFLASRKTGPAPAAAGRDDDDQLPAPSPDTPQRTFFTSKFDPETMTSTAADPSRSPLAASVVSLPGVAGIEGDIMFAAPKTDPLWSDVARVRDKRPSVSPSLEQLARLEEIRRGLPLSSPLEARDSLPPQVLRLLVPPLRSAVLFLVRGAVAVGWDGRTPSHGKDAIRDVLLPLTAPSAFERALTWGRVAVGNAADPTTVERIFMRHLGLTSPTSFAVMPILVGDLAAALLYVDRGDGMLDDAHIDSARQIGTTLADGLAPFVAAGTLFPPVRTDLLRRL